jgi:hypothetical protein
MRKQIMLGMMLLAVFVMSVAAASTSAQAAEESRVQVYGFAQMDAIYDFNTMNPAWNAALRPSKIPVNCPGDSGCGKDGETIFSVRQSRLGAKATFPTSKGDLNTKFEFDMFGVGPDEGKTTIRLRHAYGELGSFLAGQTNSLFMDGDVFPNTIEYWGPIGMVFFRNIQARWTVLNQDGTKVAVALEAPGSAVDSGNIVVVDPSFPGVQGYTQFPDVTGQYRMDQGWGHVQASGILRWLGWETPANVDSEPSDNVMGWGVNLAGGLKTIGKDQLLVQVAYGEGIASYMNDCCVDVAPNAALNDGEAVPLLAWLVYYDHYWSDRWSSSIGLSATDQDNTDGQTADAMAKGSYASANLLHYPAQNVMVGGELIWGQRENKNGADASDTRFQFSAKYSF